MSQEEPKTVFVAVQHYESPSGIFTTLEKAMAYVKDRGSQSMFYDVEEWRLDDPDWMTRVVARYKLPVTYEDAEE